MAKSSKSSHRRQDPFYQREREKYANPIASREYILETLSLQKRPVSKKQLLKALNIKKAKEEEALCFRLRAMIRDGQIIEDRRGRYCLLDKINLLRGTIFAHPDGFGFFIPDIKKHKDQPDLSISPKEMRSVMHGDIVLAFETGIDRRGRPECRVHEVLEHANPRVVGRFFVEQGITFVSPDNKRILQDILIPEEHTNQAQHGQVVLVDILNYPSKQSDPIGKVTHILGDHLAPGMEIKIATLAHNLPHEWPDEVHASLRDIPDTVTQNCLTKRTDLRALPFVTIDGEDAKDFDDAVYCEVRPKGGFRLYVAIADVSHYVPPHSPLDKEAELRGNSVYFPEYVIPMLPEVLSNGICSLNPHVDRLCMVMEMAISDTGHIQRSRVYRGVIHSKARLTYTEVGAWLSGAPPCNTEHHTEIWPHIKTLKDLFHTLLKTRKSRGAIDFSTTETRIIFDENRKIQQIIPVIRNDAHRLIEECMLAANVSAARFLERHKIPTLYRVHPAPEEDKITALRQFLGEFGLTLGGGKKPSPKDFQKTLTAVGDRPERHLIETVMLRSLKQAQYVESNDGHFGLAYSAYTHFTSPIRRYPDLLIHRAIGHILDKHPIHAFIYDEHKMSQLGAHCSTTERRADEATREVISWLKCEYMQAKIGQNFSGKISAVTGFGLFVELDEIYVEGLVHITSLVNDYYAFDAVKHRLRGERTGKTYRLGDPITILVARVDLDERKIDFEPVNE